MFVSFSMVMKAVNYEEEEEEELTNVYKYIIKQKRIYHNNLTF